MAIGSPNRARRLEQLRTYARCQVWSGYGSPEQVYDEVCEAVRDDVTDAGEAERLAADLVAQARAELDQAAAGWPSPTGFERLQAALDDLRAAGVVVLEAVDDHWAAHDALAEQSAHGPRPLGLAYFTHTDIWHAVVNGMLELNVWHGSTANVAEGEELLSLACDTLARHGLPAHFDEGRIEVTMEWQRKPAAAGPQTIRLRTG
jgi:hypothetical protein